MNYYAKRVGQAVFTYFATITLAFVLFRLMPGGPIQAMKQQLLAQAASQGTSVSVEHINRLVEIRTGIQPDLPLHVQYYNYMTGIIFHQDFGESITHSQPVFDILFKAMPWSVFISVYGLLLGFATNVVLGAVMAYREGSRFDSGMTVLVMALSSIPYYVGAIIMLAVLAFQLGWFPTSGRVNTDLRAGFNVAYMSSIAYHAALPILSSFIVGFGSGALGMRGNSIRVLGEDYLRVARLRGLSDSRISVRYVARNAVLPLYTSLMIGIASVFSSSVILETIFTYPGVGWYTFGALQSRDYPLLMGALLFFTLITITGVLIADLTYGLIDPRAKTGDHHESF